VDLSTLANVATALTVLTGVAFGLVEARRARQDREERAAFAAPNAILTPNWKKSIVIVHAIPEGATATDIEADPRVLEATHIIGITLEGLGYAVFARIVPLKIVDDLVGGSVRVAWRNMRQYVEFERNCAGSQKSWEWFQWLAEQLERHGKSKTNLKIGAPIAYRDWKP
jgi:hypothetical protein